MKARDSFSASWALADALIRSVFRRRRRQAWTRDDLLRYQQRRLRTLLSLAYRRSRFYRDLYDKAGVNVATTRLEDLPPVTKEMLMAEFDRVVTVPGITRADVDRYCARYAEGPDLPPKYQGRYIITRSSGSGGAKGTFVIDAQGFRRMLESILAYCPVGLVRGTRWPARVAGLFSADNFHLGYTIFQRLTLPGVRAVAIPAASTTAHIVDALMREQPTILAGYPSTLSVLSDEVTRGHLRLSPQTICSGGERLTSALRAKIQHAFGCFVYDFYGCAEANPIAIECGPAQRLHVIEDSVIFEPVDADLRPVGPGQMSAACLVTNLTNAVMPIIRYKIPDQVVVSAEPCPCGCAFACLDAIEGRSAGLLHMAGRDGGDVTIHPSAVLDLAERDAEVEAVQLRQDRRNHFELLIVLVPHARADSVRARLTERVQQYLGACGVSIDPDTVSLSFVDHIPPEPVSGKVLDFKGLPEP